MPALSQSTSPILENKRLYLTRNCRVDESRTKDDLQKQYVLILFPETRSQTQRCVATDEVTAQLRGSIPVASTIASHR